MSGVSVALGGLARSALRGFLLLALWGIWLGGLGLGGAIVYRQVFHFDATDWTNWVEVRRLYLKGATIPFNFAAIALGLPVVGVIGCVILGFRCSPLSRRLSGWRPVGFLSGGLVFSPFGSVPQRDRSGGWRGARSLRNGFGTIGQSVFFVWSLGRGLIQRLRSMRREVSRFAAPETEDAPAVPSVAEPAAAAGNEATAVAAMAVPVADPASVAPLPDRTDPQEPVMSEAADGPISFLAPDDEDYAVFGRVMALFEVWSDPAPDWMQAAMREELETLSVAGWGLFMNFGDPAMSCLETVAAAGLLPVDPTRLAAATTLLERHRTRAVPEAILAEEAEPSPFEKPLDDGRRPSPATVARLSMGAAWLCEMVDNFVMLEDIRAAGDAAGAPPFEDRWGAIYRETGERLKVAMQTMTDEDWRSIDRFPDRAGRIRVLTDRLREELRALPVSVVPTTQEEEGQVSSSSPLVPDIASLAAPSGLPPEASSPGIVPSEREDAQTASLEEILLAAGYVVRVLPTMRGPVPGEPSDYLAQRDDFSVLLRLADLSGGDWSMDGDSLAPWRGGAGHALPSPCRAVWQRLALLRSLGKETKPCAAVVVLRGGHFTDEQAVARIIERDRCRTDVDLAWLDRSASSLPDLPAWLQQMEARVAGIAS